MQAQLKRHTVDDYHTVYICLYKILNSTILAFIKRKIFQVYIKFYVCHDIIFYETIIEHLFNQETHLFSLS